MPTVQTGPSILPPTIEQDCPLCQSTMVAKIRGIKAEETGATFGVDSCPGCGLGRTRPLPADLAPYYDSAYYGKRHGLTAWICRRRRLRIVERWAGTGDGRSLLDYGCAEGDFLLAARSKGWNGVGVERDQSATAPRELTIVASLDALAGRGPFDCATFWHVLEHLDDPVGTLSEVRSRLKSDGLVIAAVPNFRSWQARVTGASWLHLDLPRHLSHFTPKSIIKTFEAGGFQVESLSFGEFEYDLVGWSQSLLNLGLGGRNDFFRAMSGRPSRGSAARKALHTVAGLGVSLLAVAPTFGESWFGRGGTMIVIARPAGSRR